MATFRLPHFQRDERPHLGALEHAFWAACGSVVLLYIFFAALDAFDPTEVIEATVVVLLLAVLWLSHAWRDLWRDERRQR